MNQELRDLRYRLISGTEPPNLAPLRVLATGAACSGGWEATFFILGASHAVTLNHDGITVTELLTCVPPPATKTVVASDAPTSMPPPGRPIVETRSLPGGAIADVRIWVETLSADALELPPTEHALEVEFPAAESGTDAAPPRTWLGWTRIDDALIWHSLHTYPKTGACVRSTTRMCLTRGNANAEGELTP